ncbi:MAG TPA: glycosyltransferase family 2 protein [Gemmatimonadales bacterium]|nr:glycosyltransferase family 2 protein [Gemmatimonadales bacterium]
MQDSPADLCSGRGRIRLHAGGRSRFHAQAGALPLNTPTAAAARPSITVLVPTFNRAAMLAECLESLLAQTLPPTQILVVNDGSTDETPEVLARFGDTIEVLEVSQGGKAGAVNAGLARVTGEYLWVFDDDDVALPDALERIVAPLEADRELGFTYGMYAPARSRPDGRIGPAEGTSWLPNTGKAGMLPSLLLGNYMGGAALFARTACYRELGGLSPELIRSQDYDLAIRMVRRFRGAQVEGPPFYLYRKHDGLRGDARTRFGAAESRHRWLEYDQIIFRRLREELPITAHLPPGADAGREIRHALIHRMVVSAFKLMYPEARADLAAIAELDDSAPLTPDEKGLLVLLIRTEPYYGKGSILDQPGFFADLGRLARRYPAMRRIRREIVRALLTRLGSDRQWSALREVIRTARLVRLAHFPGRRLRQGAPGPAPRDVQPQDVQP